VAFERPGRFVDEMLRGAFRSPRHAHEFAPDRSGTLMKDTLVWSAPFGDLGRLADRLILERHMRGFLERRNLELRRYAESKGGKIDGGRCR